MKHLRFKALSGYETIEVIQFNYDGIGNALIRANGELDHLDLADLKEVMFEPLQGEKTHKEL
jgi:hypothetical protein